MVHQLFIVLAGKHEMILTNFVLLLWRQIRTHQYSTLSSPLQVHILGRKHIHIKSCTYIYFCSPLVHSEYYNNSPSALSPSHQLITLPLLPRSTVYYFFVKLALSSKMSHLATVIADPQWDSAVFCYVPSLSTSVALEGTCGPCQKKIGIPKPNSKTFANKHSAGRQQTWVGHQASNTKHTAMSQGT